MGAETINTMGHTDMIGVSYKSSPQAILDLAAGRVQVMVADFTVARLEREVLASLAQADVRGRLATIGFDVEPQDNVAFRRFVREQLDAWGKLILAAKIQPE